MIYEIDRIFSIMAILLIPEITVQFIMANRINNMVLKPEAYFHTYIALIIC